MNLQKDTPYVIGQDVISKEDSNGKINILLLSQDEVFFRIDKIAAQSWKYITEGKTFNEILQILSQQYPQHQARIEEELVKLFQNLVDHKIISPA